MYSRQFFVKQFRGQDTDELLRRMATSDLTKEAGEAMRIVLRERGIASDQIASLVRQAGKASYRTTTPTNQCDFCGKSALLSTVRDAGQKFCSESCLRSARLMEAAVDLQEEEILAEAMKIKRGACPSCLKRGRPVEVRKSYWVWSALLYTRWGTTSKLCCRTCGIKSNTAAIVRCVLLGWWGFPFGLLLTPAHMVANVAAALRREEEKPSDELVQAARMQLAEVLLAKKTAGTSDSRVNGTARSELV